MQYGISNDSKIKNILMSISYDGSNYHGWQIQKNALSIQEVFQTSLKKVIGKNVDIKGCSRTDSGVHANMYCISFKIENDIPCERLQMAVNRFLPEDIVVNKCIIVPKDFHARYSCIGKEYLYKIWNNKIRNPFLNRYAYHYWYPIDIELLNNACKSFIGKHDFTSFCTLDNRRVEDMERTIKKFKVEKDGDLISIIVEADGFLYNMVRIMIGTLLHVAEGKISCREIENIILAKNRKLAGPTAVPYGLYLNRVFYRENN